MTQVFPLASLWSRTNQGSFDESDFMSVVKTLPSLSPQGPWLAGGSLRRLLSDRPLDSDFDLFFRDEAQLAEAGAVLEASGFWKVRETEHHVQYKGSVGAIGREVDVQCIRFRWYTTAAEVIDSFDFTICQFAYDGEVLTCGDLSLWDLGRKVLVLHKLTYPVSTMRRVLKYAKQGFNACAGCLSSILTATASSPELLASLDIEYVD